MKTLLIVLWLFSISCTSLFSQTEIDSIRINKIKEERINEVKLYEKQIEEARERGDLFTEMVVLEILIHHIVTNFGDNTRAYKLNRYLENLIKENPNERAINVIEARHNQFTGMLFRDQSKHEESLQYFVKAEKLAIRDSLYDIYRDVGGHIGEAYSHLGENEKALAQFNKVEEKAKFLEYNKDDLLARINEFRAHHFFRKERLDSALYYVKKSLYDDSNFYESSVRNILIADILIRLNHNIDSSMFYIKKGLKIAVNNGLEREEILAHRLIHKLYNKQGNYEKAYYHFNKFYELEQEQRSFDDALQIGNVNLEREKEASKLQQKLTNERLSNQRLIIWIVLGGLLLLIGGLLYIFNRLKLIRKQNKIIEQEKLRAEQSERYKEQFLANMSHEIRTPMHAISGMVNALRRRNHSKEQVAYLDAMKISSDNLLVILNDVLDMSKIESGSLDIEQVQMNPSEIINHVVNIFQYKVEEKGLLLKTNIEKDFPKNLLGDPGRFNQVVMNLVSNAIKFTESGTIEISLSQANNKLKVAVQDTGSGISEVQTNTIFESFKQGNNVTKGKQGGTGLGLAISKQLVELQNGTIWVESEIGKGSVFYVELPLIVAEATTETTTVYTEEKLKAIGKALEGIRILIAEDNDFNVMVVQDDLEWYKPSVNLTFVENGKEALEKYKKETYDVVLMDVQMPEMNGYEATKQIRQFEINTQGKKTSIIAMTASLLKEQVNKCFDAGMDAYIPKPYKPEQLINTIKRVISE